MTVTTRLRSRLSLGLLALLLSGCLSSGGGNDSASENSPPSSADNRQNSIYLRAAAIGVADLDAALQVYTEGLGMSEVERVTRDDRIEVVLESADKRGSYIVLMSYTDDLGRNTLQNPGKLVFYAKDPSAFASRFVLAGGRITVPPAPQASVGGIVVGFGRDQDNNLIEITGSETAQDSYFGAFGIGVSDLESARNFYVDTLGFLESQFLSIPGQYDEYILTSPVPGSSAMVLMHWTNATPRNYIDNPVKLELASAQPQRLSDAITEAGETVSLEPAASTDADLKGALVGYATDADGTLLEIRQSLRAYLSGAAIGVSSLDDSLAFYLEGLGMREIERRTRENREEVVLESADGRGSQVILMGFTDGVTRNYRQNPGKLVFYAKDPTAFAQDIRDAGGVVLVEPVDQGPALGNAVVGFGRDLDNNLIEIVGDAAANESYFGAFGIGVSDLAAAKAFYADTLGFKVSLFLPIAGQYNEYILQGYGGSALVLMNWTNGSVRNYTDNPVKLEIATASPEAFIQTIDDAGQRIIQTPEISEEVGRSGQLVGYAKDADGTLLEVLLAPWGQLTTVP
ncbi:VOC family protein [Pseudomonas neustonica]|uniref:VOC family protein n=1 Tax=Pseudomonas neustonica TaxID=2487346 RepID=UPI003F48EC9B